MGMKTMEIRYVPVEDPFEPSTETETMEIPEQYQQRWQQIIQMAAREMRDHSNFLRLQYQDPNTKAIGICYYNQSVNGILGDLSFHHVLEVFDQYDQGRQYLEFEDEKQTNQVGPWKAGLMNEWEYNQIIRSGTYYSVRKQFGWIDLSHYVLAVVRPIGLKIGAGSRKPGDPVYVLPIHRCTDLGIRRDSSLGDILLVLLRQGLIPLDSHSFMANNIRNFDWLNQQVSKLHMEHQRLVLEEGVAGRKARAGSVAKIPDPAQLEKIRDYYYKSDYRKAHLPSYERNLFQPDKGSWDLFRYASIEADTYVETEGRSWYEVSNQQLYARDPRYDVVSDTEMVAIDFGTKSTTVAAMDNHGNINLLPIGLLESRQLKEQDYENPTILKCVNVGKFAADYRRETARPETQIEDMLVSHEALRDFEKVSDHKNVLQYLHQLKQWANDPGRKQQIWDGNLNKFELYDYKEAMNDNRIDPVEIYAYYIGLNINHMHRGKIYLKYLLSYSATYLEESCEHIRESFEKGLKKSLPPAVVEDEELMKKFEVKLWRDEASSYAICAISRYMEEAANQEDQSQFLAYQNEMRKGGLLYGIYDFGGGTLDFSFGIYDQDEEGNDVYELLTTSGASHLGCENILEELAFHFYIRNRQKLFARKIKCVRPSQLSGMGGEEIIGDSNEARFNTIAMVNFIRKLWMGEDLSRMGNVYSIKLYGDDGTSYLFKPFAATQRQGNNIPFRQDNRQEMNNPEPDETLKQEKQAEQTLLSLNLVWDKDRMEGFFQEKVKEGVGQFFTKYKELRKDNLELHDRKCHIFLAGNASKAKRVMELFQSIIQALFVEQQFEVMSYLPTQRDQTLAKANKIGSIPTAKTGVVYGLLLARPGAENTIVKSRILKSHFLYHIGFRKKDYRDTINGVFQLAIRADEMPASKDAYKRIRKISQSTFELLYSDDPRYGVRSEPLPSCINLKIVQIVLDEAYIGQSLYGRALEGSHSIIELAAAAGEESSVAKAAVVGVCYLDGNSVFVREEGRSRTPVGHNIPTTNVEAATVIEEAMDYFAQGELPYDLGIEDPNGQISRKIRAGELNEHALCLGVSVPPVFRLYYRKGTEPFTRCIQLNLGYPGEKKEIYCRYLKDPAMLQFRIQIGGSWMGIVFQAKVTSDEIRNV